jgi:hypothetical protein
MNWNRVLYVVRWPFALFLLLFTLPFFLFITILMAESAVMKEIWWEDGARPWLLDWDSER